MLCLTWDHDKLWFRNSFDTWSGERSLPSIPRASPPVGLRQRWQRILWNAISHNLSFTFKFVLSHWIIFCSLEYPRQTFINISHVILESNGPHRSVSAGLIRVSDLNLDSVQEQASKQTYTCRPMTHCPAFIFSSSNILSCLSAYFTPMSDRELQPLVLALKRKKWNQLSMWTLKNHTHTYWHSQCILIKTHHASQCEQRRLHLRHVAGLKQVVGLEEVMRLQLVHSDGFDEVRQILHLKKCRKKRTDFKTISNNILKRIYNNRRIFLLFVNNLL